MQMLELTSNDQYKLNIFQRKMIESIHAVNDMKENDVQAIVLSGLACIVCAAFQRIMKISICKKLPTEIQNAKQNANHTLFITLIQMNKMLYIH